jgi:arylsulfatase
MKFANGIPDTIEANMPMLDELGGPKTYNHYPNGWAMAFNTPFKMWKRYEFNGGTSDPCIISWPAGITSKGEIRDQYHHAIDIVPTLLDALGVEPPQTIKGHVQSDFDGVSMRSSFDDAKAPTTRSTQFYSMLGSRAIWHDGWKAVTNHPDDRRLEQLQRRRVGALPHRGRPVRAAQPRRRASREGRELVNLWFAEAGPTTPSSSTTRPRSRS